MLRFVLFSLDGESFGVDVRAVVEIVNPRKIRPLPDMPRYIPGVLMWRGALIPTVDMRLRLGMEPADPFQSVRQGRHPRMIIVRAGAERIALLVDHVDGIEKVERQSLTLPPMVYRGLKRDYIVALMTWHKVTSVILRPVRLLTSEELIRFERAVSAISEGAPA